MWTRIVKRAGVIAVSLMAATAAQALSLSPVKFELLAGQRAAQLTLANDGDAPRTYDVRVHNWLSVDQETGRSILSEKATSAILVSRPVITVQPKASATIRLAVAERTGAPADYYRVVVEDVTPDSAFVPTASGSAANIKLSASMPLQVHNTKGLIGKLERTEAGVKNVGSNIVVILGSKDGQAFGRYVMPGEVWGTTLQVSELDWIPGIQ